jgi:hypothetical protein
MPAQSDSGSWSRRYIKGLIVVFGTLLGGMWVVANFFGLYYAKLALFDHPTVTMELRAAQVATDHSDKQIVITLEMENSGVRQYEVMLERKSPIVIVRITKDQPEGKSTHEDNLFYQVVKSISLPSVYPDKDGQLIVRNPKAFRIGPGQKGKHSVTTLVPGPGVYFIEFTGEVPYGSVLEWVVDKVVGRPTQNLYFSASTIAHVK